jgi:uncharacterized protein (DUF1330 family)
MVAYLVGELEVHDPNGYQHYASRSRAVVERHGGRYIARGGATLQLEGNPPEKRIVLVEFPSVGAAETFYASPEYQELVPIRQAAAKGRLYVVDGFA